MKCLPTMKCLEKESIEFCAMIEWIACPTLDCLSMFCSQYDCVYTLAATIDHLDPLKIPSFSGRLRQQENHTRPMSNRFVCPQVNDFVSHDINTNPPCDFVCLWTPFMLDFGADNVSVSVYIRKRVSTGAGHATLDDFDSYHVRPSKKVKPLEPIDMHTIDSALDYSKHEPHKDWF